MAGETLTKPEMVASAFELSACPEPLGFMSPSTDTVGANLLAERTPPELALVCEPGRPGWKLEPMWLRLQSISWEADRIFLFEFRHSDGDYLPSTSPGDHIDLKIATGVERSYSLLEACERPKNYQIAVLRGAASHGGSAHLHEHARVGELFDVSPPRNSFALAATGACVFIAGGIGITPFLSMAAQLAREGRSFVLHHVCRNPGEAVFADRLFSWSPDVHRHYTRLESRVRPSVASLVASSGSATQLYCCGPPAMIADFQQTTVGRDPARLHVERFAAAEAKAEEGGFLVELARSGRTVSVPPGETILETLLREGVRPPHSCREGVCGQCETRVLAGVPDHRDGVLTPAERNSNQTMMICCSGAKSSKLVLDI
jgi:vanillate O-demethylase ferredoxin subunit